MEYQHNFTKNPVAASHMYDESERDIKARKIIAILKAYLGDTSQLSILDVSCSTGIICQHYCDHFLNVTGIDIDTNAVNFAKKSNKRNNIQFLVQDALNTSFPDKHFDVVVCNQMYEHVPDAQQLLNEIERILVPGGICYFGATNRLKVIETHYGNLPFLSYCPKLIANLYLKCLGRGDYYYENLYTYWTLKKISAKFNIIDYTQEIVAFPEKYALTDMVNPGGLKQKLALILLKYAYWLSPGFIWLLKKETVKY